MGLEVEIEKSLPDFTLRVAFQTEDRPVGILGPSGAGKTVTLRAIAGLEAPARGRIALDGRVLFDSAARINVPSRARGIGLLFQHYALFPHLTVEENIAYGLRRLPREDRVRRAQAQMAALRLSGFERRYPAALSGGEQQRTALARALAPQPAALLLDEPFSALDAPLRSQLERELPEMLAGYRGATLLVSHDLEEIYRLCEKLVVLDKGAAIAQGSPDEIFRHPPNLATARLTGCKNFSRARAQGDYSVEALDWRCVLRVAQKAPCASGHLAIRAHHVGVELPSSWPRVPETNSFPCWLASVSEAPFRVALYLHLHAPPPRPADHHLQAEITQEHWARIKTHPLPWTVYLDPERLFLLPD